MIYHTETLSNGLRIVHMEVKSPVSYCGFIIKAGSRDESDNEQGLAHFIEHMLFKGTEKRKAWHILNRMENVGGELNAYTTKEETFLYSVFLSRDFHRAIELQSDMVFRSIFPDQGVEKEKDVILDEINSYQDTPAEQIYDDFEDILFNGHSLGHNILGTPDTLSSFDKIKGKEFTDSFYVPENIVFFSSGSTPFKTVSYYAKKYLNDIPASHHIIERVSPPPVTPSRSSFKKDTHQTHMMIGSKAYDLYDDRKNTLFFLNNVLGGPGMNSLLNISLREKNGLVYTIESNVTNYTDTGVFSIYFGTDQKKAEKCTELVLKELKKLREQKLSSMQIEIFRKQLSGQIIIASESRENTFLNSGKSFLHFDKIEKPEDIYIRINKISQEDLLNTANEIFNENNFSYLIYN